MRPEGPGDIEGINFSVWAEIILFQRGSGLGGKLRSASEWAQVLRGCDGTGGTCVVAVNWAQGGW